MTLHPQCEEKFNTLNKCLESKGLFNKIIGVCDALRDDFFVCMDKYTLIKRKENLVKGKKVNEEWKSKIRQLEMEKEANKTR